MNWLEVSVSASHEASEAVYAVMSEYAPGAVAIEEPVVQPRDGDGAHIDYSQPVTVSAYLPMDGEEQDKRRHIEEGVWHLGQIDIAGVGDVTVREMAEEDWANAWKEHYRTRKVGNRLVIKPSWLEYEPADDEVIVELDPGMAFGTGLHPTTDTCLKLLEEVVHGGEHILDLGTGSGILALAAVGLGASSVLALDTESVAVEAAAANASAAGYANQITVERGSLPLPMGHPSHGTLFDVVLANIIARVLIELAPALKAVLRPGGPLMASGIIIDREAEVVKAFEEAGLPVQRRVQSGDWISLVCRANS